MIKTTAHYDLILFDFDGALVDSAPAIAHCFGAALESLGLPDPGFDAVRRTIGTGLTDSFRALAPDLDDDGAAEAVVRYRDLYAKRGAGLTALFPHVTETLDILQNSGLTMAVVSNKNETALLQSLDELGLTRYFSAVYGVLPNTPHKPDPAVYATVLQRLARRPERPPLMAGDTPVDIAFGKAVGHACYLRYGYGDDDACCALAPDHIIQGMNELPILAGCKN